MLDLASLASDGPFVVFLAVFLGVSLGQVRIGSFSLGASGTLFSGLALGALGFTVDHAYFVLSLVLFIAAIGLLTAEDLAHVLRTYGAKFVVLAVVMSAVAAGFTNFAQVLFGATDPWLIRGAYAGAVTSSPSLAAALDLAPAPARDAISAGYAVSYPVGLIAVILFAQFAPAVTDLDVAAERRRFEASIGASGGAESDAPASTAFSLAGFSLAIVLGSLVGLVPIPLGPFGSVTLDVTGGTLVAALRLGHLRRVGPVETRMARPILIQIREIAIGIFLAVVGIESAARFAEAAATQGAPLVVTALLIATGSMVVGFVLVVVVWELDWICAIGAIAGGMTSTPRLGAPSPPRRPRGSARPTAPPTRSRCWRRWCSRDSSCSRAGRLPGWV